MPEKSRQGILTVSIDLELMWGIWDLASLPADESTGQRERLICRRLVLLFERYGIRATWAIVGRLFDDEPGFVGLRGSKDDWYAPDVVELLTSSSVRHDIGSHSYSHRYFGSSSRDAAERELLSAQRVHARLGRPMTSFVFPRNQVAHLDLLQEVGVRVFRSRDRGILGLADSMVPSARPALNLLEKALALPVSTILPIRHPNGLVELPSSLLLLGRGGIRRIVTPLAMRRKLRQGLDRAVRRAEVFHLWFHPSNFYDDPETQFALLEEALSEAQCLVEHGDLQIRTMSDFAKSDSLQ